MWHAWERREKCTRFWWEIQKERDHVEDRGVDWRMGSEWIIEWLVGGCRVDPVGSGYGPVVGCCEYGYEPAGSGATELRVLHKLLEPCDTITVLRISTC
jgi:hypothetical protein